MVAATTANLIVLSYNNNMENQQTLAGAATPLSVNATHSVSVHHRNPQEAAISISIFKELSKAEAKLPNFPDDIIHQVAVMAEESGEAVRSALQLVYEDGSVDDLKKELLQTAAMCVRTLKSLEQK